MRRAVIIYSGGMDSFTLLNDYIAASYEVFPITFNYGQRHRKEIDYAQCFCAVKRVEHKIIDLTCLNPLLQGSSLTSDIDVPEGHYQEESMKQTVVPNRNMIMLSIAIGYAISKGIEVVATGAHAGDHAIYPDCRPEFITALNHAATAGNYGNIKIEAPYINSTKGEIALIGEDLSLDYSMAWTCYNGREKACGKCGACQERIEAMAFAGINDTMEYE